MKQGAGIKNRVRERLTQKILELDSYGAPISFNYANGSTLYSTGLGACLNIFVTLLTLTYFCNSLRVMFNYKGSTLTASVADSVFNYNDTITYNDGFRIAIGLDPRWGA